MVLDTRVSSSALECHQLKRLRAAWDSIRRQPTLMTARSTGATTPPHDQQTTDSQDAQELALGDAATVVAGGHLRRLVPVFIHSVYTPC
jgi:hypothetical protein